VADSAIALLDARLSQSSRRPVAVAVSGGGDSVALALIAQRWAQEHGRRLLVLTVDHRLQAQSAAWTKGCAELAVRLGADFRALAWEGPKPAAGLPAAARAARHILLAEAAREAGAHVILLGHTADDVLEARAMRDAGSTTPEPRVWSPSPAWPQGRGLFLLRPLLVTRRAALRGWLTDHGESWIDDPANEDLRYARPRARKALADDVDLDLEEPRPLELAVRSHVGSSGAVTLGRDSFREAARAATSRWLGLAAVCAGGGARLPASAARDRLAERLRGADPVFATLAGARVSAGASQIRVVREGGEAGRGGLSAQALTRGVAAVWDGRLEVTALTDGVEVRKLAGLARRLPEDQRRVLAKLPADVRGGLPAVIDAEGRVRCPLLGEAPAVAANLVGDRLRAAAGLIEREPD